MVFLPVPFSSSSWISWNNVAGGFGCFCVQERTTAGEAKNESIGYRLLSAEEDLKPFRIIYTTVSADFADTENERRRVMARSGDGGNVRSVVAVADSLATILADWGLLMKAWPAVYAVKSGAANQASASAKPAPTTPTLADQDWRPVYAYMRERHAKGTSEEGVKAAAAPAPPTPPLGPSGSAAAAAATAEALPAPQPRAEKAAAAAAAAKKSQTPSSSQTSRAKDAKGPRHGATLDVSGAYFNLYDAAVLQLCDIFTWQSPQLSSLVLLAVAFGGRVLPSSSLSSATDDGGSGSTGAALLLLPWPMVLGLLLAMSLPLTHSQTHRRRLVLAVDVPHNVSSGEAAVREAEVRALAVRVAADEERLRVFAKLSGGVHGGPRKKQPTSDNAKKARFGSGLYASPVVIGLLILCLLQFVLVTTVPTFAPGAILDLFAAPAVALVLLVMGTLRLAAALKGSPASPAVPQGKKVKLTAAKLDPSPPTPTAPAVAATAGKDQKTTKPPPPAAAAAAAAAATGGPAIPVRTSSVADSSTSTPKPPAGGGGGGSSAAAYKYRLPALTDKESTVLQQLTNYGAPFSMVLLKPLREWNQTQGWQLQWEREGLRCEEHTGGVRGDTMTIRLTANIPNANVGTLQAVLLDDPDFLDGKSTLVYQYTPLLSQRCVVKRLAYNMFILLTRQRSPVYGIPPLELLNYVSPAVLLDPEQQAALEIRRPFAGSHHRHRSGGTSEEFMPLDENGLPRKLMTFVQCSIPCPFDLHPTPPCQPPHVRGPTEHSLIIGMEEADGSLTLGVCTSMNPKGLVLKGWEGVFRSAAVRKAGKMMELLGQEGPQASRIAVYKNQRDFQPYLGRQASSEPEPQLQKKKQSRTAMARRAANQSREAQFYTSGNALLTSDMEATIPSPSRAHPQTLSGGTPPHHSPVASLGSPSAFGAATALPQEPKLPKLPQRFVQELLTLPDWAPESTGPALKSWSCQTSFCARKANATLVFAPGVSLALAEAILLAERLSPLYDSLIERRVTVTSANLSTLLMNAAVAMSAQLPSPDFPRESYHGCSIHYTQYRSPRWGVAPRDTVTRVCEPYYFTAGDARNSLFTPEQLAALPPDVRELPPSTHMFLYCAEDASEVLPPMKQYQRGANFLSGYLCWEQEDTSAAGPAGTWVLTLGVSDADGKLLGKLADKSLQEQQQTALKLKELFQKVKTGEEKLTLV